MWYIVFGRDVQRRRIDDGRLDDRRVLHFQKRLDGLDFGLVRVIGQRASFGRQPTGCHPLGVLLLLTTVNNALIKQILSWFIRI